MATEAIEALIEFYTQVIRLRREGKRVSSLLDGRDNLIYQAVDEEVSKEQDKKRKAREKALGIAKKGFSHN
jgi:hypothetical protein